MEQLKYLAKMYTYGAETRPEGFCVFVDEFPRPRFLLARLLYKLYGQRLLPFDHNILSYSRTTDKLSNWKRIGFLNSLIDGEFDYHFAQIEKEGCEDEFRRG